MLWSVVCHTSRIQWHFQTKHDKHFKDEAEKEESIKLAIAMHRKQSSVFTNVCVSKNQATEESYKIVKCVAKHGKTFPDRECIKEDFSAVQMFCSTVCTVNTRSSSELKTYLCLPDQWRNTFAKWQKTSTNKKRILRYHVAGGSKSLG